MTLLITGGTGFVMSNLARRWLDADADARVVVLDAFGTIIQDFVQEKGVLEFGIQKTTGGSPDLPLFFDLDGNGCFDFEDVTFFNLYVAGCGGSVCSENECYDPHFDVNCDGCVDAADLAKLLGHNGNPPCNP